MDGFIFSGESFVFIPKSKCSVEPAYSECLNLRVPLELGNLVFAALDLKVWNYYALFADKYDPG